MRTAVTFLVVGLGLVAAVFGLRSNQRADAAAPPGVAVLAELFTSEGCSSCPPADDLLRRLIEEQPVAGVEVIGVSEHVDYWNRLGWTDPFSSPSFTRRQQSYARVLRTDGIYTPQLVIAGRLEAVGSDWRAVRSALVEAARAPRAAVTVSSRVAEDAGLTAAIVVRDVPADVSNDLQVVVALVEDDLAVDVRRGENARRRLRHSAVARQLATIGTLDRGRRAGEFTGHLAIDPAWRRDRLRIVAFVQDAKTLSVVGVGAARVG